MSTAQLDQPTRDALDRGGRIDITTKGRKTGAMHRIEIVFHNVGGRLFISGMPGFKRSYIANLAADPHLHLPPQGRRERRPRSNGAHHHRRSRAPGAVLIPIAHSWKRNDIDVMVELSPLFEVTIDGLAA